MPGPPCSGVGTWNPVLAQCICAIGYNGSRCEVRALPACRQSETSTAVSCPVGRPQHCECNQQCLANGAFEGHMYRYCFRRAGGGAPLSSVPSSAEAATFHECREGSNCRAVPRAQALRDEFRADLEHVPAERCPLRCSERGACLSAVGRSRGGFCKCDPYYAGPACERHSSRWCWNSCAGRGTCVDGFCVCAPPFFGPGCAHGDAAGPTAAARFRVHVYDLPPLVLRRRTYGSDPDPIFNTHHVFLEALLRDGAHLAARADEAHAFFVPALGTNMEALDEYYAHAQRAAAAHGPWWRRRRGTDHAWFTTADGGGCNLNAHPKLRRSVVLAHYLKLNASRARGGSCGARGKDVAVPPAVPAVALPAFLAAGAAPFAARRLRFFFAGNVPDAWQPGFDNRSDADLGGEAYSEGVRQLVWKHLRRLPAYRIVPRSDTYERDWAESQVCLAPMGVGWGVRLLWAVGGGCVPLLASSEVASWLDDALSWDAFALRGVPKAELPRLPALLARIGAPRLQRLQAELLRRRALLLWGGGGHAYSLTMQQLCRRATRHAPAAADCDALVPPALARELPELLRASPVPPDPPPSRTSARTPAGTRRVGGRGAVRRGVGRRGGGAAAAAAAGGPSPSRAPSRAPAPVGRSAAAPGPAPQPAAAAVSEPAGLAQKLQALIKAKDIGAISEATYVKERDSLLA